MTIPSRRLPLAAILVVLALGSTMTFAQEPRQIDFSRDDLNAAWTPVFDKGARLDISFPHENGPQSPRYLRIEFDNQYTASVQLPLANLPAGTAPRDLSGDKAIAMRTYSLHDDTSIRIMLEDAQGVQYICRRRVPAGWSDQVVYPFSEMVWFVHGRPTKGALDWTQIARIAIEPSDYSESGVIGVSKINFLPEAPAASVPTTPLSPIRLNQVGYRPGAPKMALVADLLADRFEVVDGQDQVVLEGTVSEPVFWEPSGEQLGQADFSSLRAPGTYRLRIKKAGDVVATSDSFAVAEDIGADLLRTSVRAYTLQRCSVALDAELFGPYARPAAHPDDACRLMPSTGREGVADVSGGWYDAGDYGKYVVNAGITVGTLMLSHQWYPQAVGDDLQIPESGNGVSDLADEIAVELRWLAKMQDPTDGGVYFKVGPVLWDGFVPPNQTKYERVVMGKSTTSTLDFTAIMAQASTSGIVDAPTSARYLDQARQAWAWALTHPDVSHPTEDSGTGPYDDTDYADEFLWAAAELALATNEPAFWDEVRTRMTTVPAGVSPRWQQVSAMAWIDLATSPRPVPEDVRSAAREDLLRTADTYLAEQATSPYRLPMPAFFWGSTSDQLNHAVIFAAAHRLTGEARWLDAASAVVDYVLGCNAVDRSFVTGFGHRPPMHIHHRIVLGYRYPEPFRGMLVGGPNPGIEDDVRKDSTGVLYPDAPPARQYLDHRDAASMNEVCINRNAPLVLVMSFLQTHAR